MRLTTSFEAFLATKVRALDSQPTSRKITIQKKSGDHEYVMHAGSGKSEDKLIACGTL